MRRKKNKEIKKKRRIYAKEKLEFINRKIKITKSRVNEEIVRFKFGDEI